MKIEHVSKKAKKNTLYVIIGLLEHLEAEGFTDSLVYKKIIEVLEEFDLHSKAFRAWQRDLNVLAINPALIEKLLGIVPPVYYLGNRQDEPYMLGERRVLDTDADKRYFNDVDYIYQVYDMHSEIVKNEPKTFWISTLDFFEFASEAQHLSVAEFMLSERKRKKL